MGFYFNFNLARHSITSIYWFRSSQIATVTKFCEAHGKQDKSDKSDKFRSYSVLEWFRGSGSVGLVTGVDLSSCVATLQLVYLKLSRSSSMIVFSDFSGVGLSWELLFRLS